VKANAIIRLIGQSLEKAEKNATLNDAFFYLPAIRRLIGHKRLET